MKKSFITAIFLTFSFYLAAKPYPAEEKMPSGPKPKDRPSVALVLAGGGAKGFAHLPVIELIEQMDIPIDMVVGTSIGSIIGGLYSAGYTPLQIEKSFEDIDWTPIFADSAFSPYENTLGYHSLFENLITLNLGLDLSLKLGKGVSNGQRIYELIKERTLKYPSDMDFNNLPVPFRAVVCDMLTGEALVLNEGDLAEAIRASMSLPSVFEPIEIDGRYYMDGGIRYNLAINVAKNMGYDIIIAIDISQKVRNDPDTFNSNPAVAMLNTITISQYTATQSMYKDADLVIFPDLANFGTLDFKKSSLIYEEGKRAVAKYKDSLEKIRAKIYPKDYDSYGKRISPYKPLSTHAEYESKEIPVVNSIQVDGLLPVDQKYIETQFLKIKDQPFTTDVFHDFMDRLMLTGNYQNIKARIYEKNRGNELLLKMVQKNPKSAKLCLDIDFTQTISTRMTSMLDFTVGFQYRGLTGRGSVLSLIAKTVNDYGVNFYYLQPLNTNIFIEYNFIAEDTRYPQLPFGLSSGDWAEYDSYKSITTRLDIGARTDTGRTVEFGGYYKYISSRDVKDIAFFTDEFLKYYETYEELTSEDNLYSVLELYEHTSLSALSARSIGIFLEYEINKLDKKLFPHKGVFFNLNTKYVFPYTDSWTPLPQLLMITAYGKSSIPLGPYASINTTTAIGTDVFGNLSDSASPMLVEGYTNYDRIFFPQICGPSNFGSCKLAAAISIQLEPWKKLTILGGDALLTLNGTIGNVTQSFTKMIPDTESDKEYYPILWTSGAGIAIKIKSAYSVYLRFGAASTMQKSITPFFSMDIGSISF